MKQYVVNMDVLRDLKTCYTKFQAGDGYCTIGKLYVASTGNEAISYGECLTGAEMLTKEFQEFFKNIYFILGDIDCQRVMDIHDKDRDPNKAMRYLLDLCLKSGKFTIKDSIAKELEEINNVPIEA